MNAEVVETDKQKIIAEAAFEVFAKHGFRKTSMQLIAEQAGMSRPALYLHFQSKEDVFRYLGIGYLSKVADDIEAILLASGAPVDVLQSVFDAFDPGGMKAILLDAEHGHELMEVNAANLKDVADEIGARILVALSNWLRQEADDGRIVCDTPALTAQTIVSAYQGLKDPPPNYAEYKRRSAHLACLLGKGLSL